MTGMKEMEEYKAFKRYKAMKKLQEEKAKQKKHVEKDREYVSFRIYNISNSESKTIKDWQAHGKGEIGEKGKKGWTKTEGNAKGSRS